MIRQTGLNLTRRTFAKPKKPTYRPKQSQEGRTTMPAWGREDGMLWAPEYCPKYASPKEHSNTLADMLIRQDCMRHRKVHNIPEFYAGSILRVTHSDKFVGKLKFSGRVLYRDGFGLNSRFVLRNIIDNEEKWLDDDLRYLRDAPKEYCMVHAGMIAEPAPPKTQELPIFTGKIRMLNPHWWKIPYDKVFPRPQNIYFEEWHIKEDELLVQSQVDKKNAVNVSIVSHHDWRDEKQAVMKEMERNYDRIQEIDRMNYKRDQLAKNKK